jgi:hypothetical protein
MAKCTDCADVHVMTSLQEGQWVTVVAKFYAADHPKSVIFSKINPTIRVPNFGPGGIVQEEQAETEEVAFITHDLLVNKFGGPVASVFNPELFEYDR